MIKNLLFIFLGGGIGSSLRYAVSVLMNGKQMAPVFPWSTFVVNILGSLLIGMFYSLSVRLNLSQEVRLFLTVGLCGGFTTFSSLSYENMNLLQNGMYGTFSLYVSLSIILGILAVVAGVYLFK